MQKFFDLISDLALSVTVIICVGIFCMGACYTWPNAEAIHEAAMARAEGVVPYMKQMYFHRDGRYLTNFMHWFNPLSFGWVQGYKGMPVFNFIFFLLSVRFFVRAFLISNRHSWKVSALFVVTHFALSPDICAEAFNMIGSFVYLYSISFFLLWMGALLRSFQRMSDAPDPIWFMVSVVCFVCMSGCVEMNIIIGSIWLMTLTIILFKYSYAKEIAAYIMLAGAVYFVILSNPGSRMEISRNPMGIEIFSLKHIFSVYFSHLLKAIWLQFSGSYFLLFPSSLLLAMYLFSASDPIFVSRFRKLFSLIFFTAVVSAVLCVIPFYLFRLDGTGFNSRIFNIPYFFFQFSSIAVVFLIITFLLRVSSLKLSIIYLIAVVWVISGLLFGENNFTNMYEEYRKGVYSNFNYAMQEKHDGFNVLRKDHTHKWVSARVTIPEVEQNKSLIYLPVLSQPDGNLKRFYQTAYEKYYMLDEVLLNDDTLSKRDLLKDMYIDFFQHSNP